MNNEYEVGDIVYLLSKKNHKIVPALVESVITVKKIGGTDITHELSIPGSGPEQKIILENLDVNAFKSVQLLKTHMLQIAEAKVNTDITTVEELVRKLQWPTDQFLPVPDIEHHGHVSKKDKKEKSPVVKVQMPDGSTANVQMPQELI